MGTAVRSMAPWDTCGVLRINDVRACGTVCSLMLRTSVDSVSTRIQHSHQNNATMWQRKTVWIESIGDNELSDCCRYHWVGQAGARVGGQGGLVSLV